MPPVYGAKYSNVPVWVSTIKNVSVMRRQGDGWVNATHLLKVADFDKPRRTRILERDVQTGEHEKVQGGYGKYQGTWIPIERAKELSEQVGILDLVNDLLVYAPKDGVVTEDLPRQPKPMTVRKTHPSDVNTTSASKAKRAKKANSLPAVSMPMPPRAQSMQSMPTIDGSYPMWSHQSYSPQGPYTPNGGNNGNNQLQSPMNLSMPGMAGMPVVPRQGFAPMNYQQQQEKQPNSPYHAMQSPIPQQQYQYSMDQRSGGASGNLGDVTMSAGSSPSLSSSVLSSGSDGFSDDERPYLGGAFRQPQQRLAESSLDSRSRPALNGNNDGMNGIGAAAAAAALSPVANRNLAIGTPNVIQHLQTPQEPVRPVPVPSQYMAEYSSKLLDYLMSPDKSIIPAFLLHPQPGPHINQPIDDEGNTAFHWTCAIGKTEIMLALVEAGSNTHALNNAGQKPLVRAVMFTNNYEARTFTKVLEMLADSAGFVDPNGRTILHHIASTAISGSHAGGARYYAEILLAKLTVTPELLGPQSLQSFINQQDSRGETALHICSRANSKRLAKVLLSYGASPNVVNKAGVTPEEMFRSNKASRGSDVEPTHTEDDVLALSQSRAVSAAQRSTHAIGGFLTDFAESYDTDLNNKDSDINQVQDLLTQIRQRVTNIERDLPELENEAGTEEDVLQTTEELETVANQRSSELRQLVERSQARDLALLALKEETDARDQLREQLKSEQFNEDEQYTLAQTLTKLQNRRISLLDEIIVLYSNSGSREKIKQYRKLLAICCEVAEDEVDGLLDGITQALSA